LEFDNLEKNFKLYLINTYNDPICLEKLLFENIKFEKFIKSKLIFNNQLEILCDLKCINYDFKIEIKKICSNHVRIANDFDKKYFCSECNDFIKKDDLINAISINKQLIPINIDLLKIREPFILEFICFIKNSSICQTYLKGNTYILEPFSNFTDVDDLNKNDTKFFSLLQKLIVYKV
jgi:hypothetical protein